MFLAASRLDASYLNLHRIQFQTLGKDNTRPCRESALPTAIKHHIDQHFEIHDIWVQNGICTTVQSSAKLRSGLHWKKING